jgi:hypothetical protein
MRASQLEFAMRSQTAASTLPQQRKNGIDVGDRSALDGCANASLASPSEREGSSITHRPMPFDFYRKVI